MVKKASEEYYIERITIPDDAMTKVTEVAVPAGCKITSAGIERPLYGADTLYLYAIATRDSADKKQMRKVRLMPTQLVFKSEILTEFVFVTSISFKFKMWHVFVEMS